MMRDGLPIAAHLALLATLALTAAFVAVVAVVIWLPPRPPDVMRADVVARRYEAGYLHMREQGRTIGDDSMQWSVRAVPTVDLHEPAMRAIRASLAQALSLTPEQVRIGARLVRSDRFVFRVHADEEHRIEIDRHELALEHDEESIEIPLPHDVPDLVEPPEPPALPESPEPPLFAPAPMGVVLMSGFEIAAELPDGRWLVMRQGRNLAELGWIARAALIIGAALMVLLLLALLFARRLSRPIRNFSIAVQAVGVDPQSEPVREEGPRELRGAARAVNTMGARLRALVADRTKTLAAVAHDMRTPLMRLRLAAENAEPDQRDKLTKEIAEIEALVASFIAFARDDPAEEARVRLDLTALLQSIADDQAEDGHDVTFAGGERIVITGQSLGLKRLFSNLVENALKYGARAHIALKREHGAVVIDVADDGPGVPPDHRESVFEPFVRLHEDGARGAGLGLAAARSIARAHGGDVAIVESAAGALLRVTLPG